MKIVGGVLQVPTGDNMLWFSIMNLLRNLFVFVNIPGKDTSMNKWLFFFIRPYNEATLIPLLWHVL